MEKNKHGIYVLKIDDIIFYVGYCARRSIYKRFEEHINESLYPTDKEKEARLIRGGPKDKEALIIAAIENNLKLEIEKILEVHLYEEVDEEFYIQHYKSLGYPITNIAKGQIFQHQIKKNNKIYSIGSSKSIKLPEIKKEEEPIDHEFKRLMFDHMIKNLHT